MFQRNDEARLFGVTAVENIFITEYLPAADGDKIKVYLYGLYRSQFGEESFGVKEMANALSIEEGQVLSALRYWERRRLVERVSDQPPTFIFHHLGQRFMTGQDQISGDEDYILFSEAVNTQLGSRRKLRESDISMAYEWVEDLGLPQEIILMLLNYFADTRGAHFSFKSAQTTAVMMKEDGISTTEDAEQFFSHSKRTHAGARAVLSQFNLRRLPTEPELALYRKWTEQWGFDDKAIIIACQETVAANNPSFSYLNGILDRIKNKVATKGSKAIKQHFKEEGQDVEQVKMVLQELGLQHVSPYTLMSAFLLLREAYPVEMIILAAKSVRARNGKFEDVEPQLMTWAKQGLKEDKQVIEHLLALKKYMPKMHEVFEASGMDGRIGETDLMRYQQWREEGHSDEVILEAGKRARSARQKLSYIQRILNDWKKQGVKTLQDVEKASLRPQGGSKKKVAFQEYDQEQGSVDTPYAGLDLLKEARDAHGK